MGNATPYNIEKYTFILQEWFISSESDVPLK